MRNNVILLPGGSIVGGKRKPKGRTKRKLKLLPGGKPLPGGMNAQEYELRVEEIFDTATVIGDPTLTRILWDNLRPGKRIRMVKGGR